VTAQLATVTGTPPRGIDGAVFGPYPRGQAERTAAVLKACRWRDITITEES